MKRLRILTNALILLTLAAPCFAQCSLKIEEAPELRGLKLGQPYEDVKKGFPRGPRMYGLNDYRDALGVRRFGISDLGLLSYGTKNDLELPEGWEKRFEGVGGVELKFLDEKLSLIEITYDRSTKWADVDEFAAAIAEGLKLPTGGWRGRAGSAELDCSGFQVRAEILLSPQVTITATGLHEEIERRKAEAEKAKRKVFKP